MDHSSGFSLVFRRAFGRVVVHIHGVLDSDSAPVLKDRLVDVIDGQGNRQVVLELRRMTGIDSAGLFVLGDALMRMREHGGELVLSGPRSDVGQRLRAAGLAEAVLTTPEWTHPARGGISADRGSRRDSSR